MTAAVDEIQDDIRQAAHIIRASKNTVFLTGAGYSTPSGIPDFRSEGSGLWNKYQPLEVASLTTFRHKPELFFAWLRPLVSHLLTAVPNPAHLALAALEQKGFVRAVLTQNIDGLHQRSGSQNVYEIHGTFRTLTCVSCYQHFSTQGMIQPYLETGIIPTCPNCENILKPDIILYEEQIPVLTWAQAEKASEQCDLMIAAGTSLDVMPSARLPLKALENGARLIIINQSPTYLDVRADLILRGNLAEIVPAVAQEVMGGQI